MVLKKNVEVHFSAITSRGGVACRSVRVLQLVAQLLLRKVFV